MKRILLLTLVFQTFGLNASAQLYGKYIEEGKKFYNKSEFLSALERFDLAYEFASGNSQKDEAKTWKNKCKEKIRAQQIKIERILKALLPKGVKNIYVYFKSLADMYYALGEYEEALKNYQLAFDSPDKPAKNTIDEDIENTKRCYKFQNNALELLKKEEYEKAMQEIIKVQKTNRNSRNDLVIASSIEPLSAMVLLQGGSFMMGNPDFTAELSDNERPVHKVTLNNFKIACYEVTNLQYAVFLNRYGSTKVLSGKFKGEDMLKEGTQGVVINNETGKWEPQKGNEYHPVTEVTWFGANAFCEYYGLSLPSEAQWEFAARGGASATSTTLYAGSNIFNEVAWCNETAKGNGTSSVGMLKANQLGIYDMSGNVWEWCLDSWHETYKGAPEDEKAWIEESKSERVCRGGGWFLGATYSRVTSRSMTFAFFSSLSLGFRPVELQKK